MTEVRATILQALGKAALFSGLSGEELAQLAGRAVRKLYSGGELLFAEGEPCAGFYIVAAGGVRIFKLSSQGREQVLAVEGPGSSIAELPVFDGGPYPASANATVETEMIFISRKDFQAFCRERPEVALKVLAVVGSRLRRLVGIIEELSFTTVRQRLIAALLRLAEGGHKTARGIALELPGSHQELANQIGTVRELVSRNLARLQAEGLLEVDGRHILIRDLKALQAVQQGES
jgi:CRP/FNR family cyclic AMP-dependent transcriptional regulator